MFWGLIMEPNKRYTQVVEKGFHISMASLDASTSSETIVQVMICYDSRNYLLCTLQKGSIWQVPLDLNFQEGTKIAFTCNGGGHVHLTGYLIPEDGVDVFGDESFDEEDDDVDEAEEIPALVNAKKRKTNNSSIEQKNSKPQKKIKLANDDDDEDDVDDDDDEDDSEGGEGMSFEDAEDSDDDDESDDDEDDDDDDDSEEQEELVKEPVSLKQQKQNKQKQNHTQQAQQNNHQNQQSKKEKQKLSNGTDAHAKQEQGKQKKNKVEEKSEKQPNQPKKRTVEGGVQIEDIKEGNGPAAKPGKFVSVYYTGRLKNGKKFDSTTQGEGFKFKLGKGEVIKGWDVGITGMKVGGKRRISIPPNMAYGARGSPPVIPPNSLLNFEVELKALH